MTLDPGIASSAPAPFVMSALGLDHIEAVAALEARVSPEPWSAKLFAGELEVHASARNWIVAHSAVDEASDEGEPALLGFGGMMFVDREGHLMNIAVDPGHQDQGLATKILLMLTHDAIARGVTDLTLEVRAKNQQAAALYRRFDYGPVGVRKGYYVDGEDALIMWAHDVNGKAYAELLSAIETRVDDRGNNS